MKTCINCGAELPDEASFCPSCATSQVEKEAAAPSRPWKRKAAAIAAIAVVIALLIGFAAWSLAPKTYEGEATVTYKLKGVEYVLVLTTRGGLNIIREPAQPLVTASVPAGIDYGFPASLIIYRADTGEECGDQFFEQVKGCTVTATPQGESEGVQIGGPNQLRELFPRAVRVADVFYNADSGTSDVEWRIELKNRDVILLRQTFEITRLPTVSYDYKNYAMNNVEQLQALIDRIQAESDPAVPVEINLPDTTYEGDIVIRGRSISLNGCQNKYGKSVFTGTVVVETCDPNIATFKDLLFTGDGSGIGLDARASLFVKGCGFENLEVGLLVNDGAWVGITDSMFRENGVGYRFNSKSAMLQSEMFQRNTFLHNGIGVELIQVPINEQAAQTLNMTGCRFEGNGTDIENLCNTPVDLSQATFRD